MIKKDIYSKGRMPYRNKEKITEFYIDPDWYKNRKPGISVMMRSYNDERWIGPVIESILPFYDEIVVAFTDGGDRTRQILESFNSKKIKIFEYPFKLEDKRQGVDIRCWNSIYDVSYFSNWGISKTTYSHVSTWDSDMIMIPKFCTKKFYDFVLSKNVVHTKGYQVATKDFKHMSKTVPYLGESIRFIHINRHTFYERTDESCEVWSYKGLAQLFSLERWLNNTSVQFQRIKNFFINKDVKINNPICFHVKPLIMREGGSKDKRGDRINIYYSDVANQKGDEIKDEIPEFIFKKPDDYLLR